MQELRDGRFGRRVYMWAPISIGGVVTVAAAALANPIVSMGAAGVSVTLQALQTYRQSPAPTTHKARLQANLVELGRDVGRNRSWLGRVFS